MEHKEKNTAKEGRVAHLPEKAPVDASGKEVLLSLKNVDITFGKGDNAVRAVKTLLSTFTRVKRSLSSASPVPVKPRSAVP